MIIAITALTILLVIHFVCRNAIKRKLQAEYERSLLNGDKERAKQLGRIYYQVINKEAKKAKGIVNIDRKIIEDFKSFNVINFV